MKTTKKISIIGATGNLGIPVTKNLISFGFQVTVIARNVEKAKKIFGNNSSIKFETADLQNVSQLTKALADTEYLYLNLSSMVTDVNVSFATEREGIDNILKSVNKSLIKQILIISGLGAFQTDFSKNRYVPNIIRTQGHELLKKSGIPYTILHCSWFLDSFLLFMRKGMYPIIGNTKNLIYFTNTFDYTNQLSNAVGNEKTFYKEYPIQGKQGINHLDAANLFFSIFNPKIKAKPMPTGLIKILAIFKKEMKPLRDMAVYFEKSKEEFFAVKFGTYIDLDEHKLSVTEFAQKVSEIHLYDYLFGENVL